MREGNRWRRNIRLAAGIVLLLIFVSLAGFYIRFELVSNNLKEEKLYDGSTANAVKHAYAAAELHKVFCYFLDEKTSRKFVLFMGGLNERAERITKFTKTDSYLEILKDFHNNLAGIAIARWQIQNGSQEQTLEILLFAANNGFLVTERERNGFWDGSDVPEGDPVSAGEKWLSAHGKDIQKRVYLGLNGRYPTVKDQVFP